MIDPQNAYSLSYLFTCEFDNTKFDSAVSRSLNYFPLCSGRILKDANSVPILKFNNEGIQIIISSNSELDANALLSSYNNHSHNFFEQAIYSADISSGSTPLVILSILTLNDGSFILTLSTLHIIDGKSMST